MMLVVGGGTISNEDIGLCLSYNENLENEDRLTKHENTYDSLFFAQLK